MRKWTQVFEFGVWVPVVIGLVLGMGYLGWGVVFGGWVDPLERGFDRALLRSGLLAIGVGLLAFAVGWPLGTWCGLTFRGSGTGAAALVLLPVAIPGCIRALSVQAMQGWFSAEWGGYFDGITGMVIAMFPWALPFPLLGAWIAAGGIGRSAMESAGMVGGAGRVFRLALGNGLRLAAIGGAMGVAGIFGDMGADQIMGFRGYGSQVLIALGARHNLGLAAWRAARGVVWMLPSMVLILWLLRRGVPVVGCNRDRDASGLRDDRSESAIVVLGVLVGVMGLGTLLPIGALLAPIWSDVNGPWVVGESLGVLRQMLRPSLIHPATGILVAEVSGFLLALVGIRCRWDRVLWMAASLALIFPGVLWHLGWVYAATFLPDFVRAWGWLVGVSAGLRMAPVVAVFWTESFRTVPVSAWEAAHLAGVGPVRFFRWVLIPAVRWRWLQSIAVVSLLVFGDLSAEMLLHAPGEGAFIGHLFSIMDNSSRVTLAGLAAVHLAFVYAAVAVGLLAFAVTLGWLAKWRAE